MAAQPWLRVRKQLGRTPIVEGRIGGTTPLYVERYLYQATDLRVSSPGTVGLITQFSPTPVREGERGQWRHVSLPSQSMLVPPGQAMHWHYTGTVDYACFYVLDDTQGLGQSLLRLANMHARMMQFSDALVGALSLQIVHELQKGSSADQAFLGRLAEVLLEQSLRVLTVPASRGINPRHAHYARLQVVLNHIHAHLADDLSVEVLARHAGVSLAHFRRLFQEATGAPPHRYVLGVRLEKARQLLTMSAMPISRIAAECGFSSQSHLTASFRAAHAVTPASYRAAMTGGQSRQVPSGHGHGG